MPSLIAYEQNRKQLPSHLVFSLAALLQFYSGTEYENGVFTGSREADENVSGAEQKYQICDDRAVLELLYATGCRVPELSGLTLDRVDLGNSYVLLIGKGNKERLVPIGHPAVKALEREEMVLEDAMPEEMTALIGR